MKAVRNASLVAGLALTATMGLATQAQASENSGWVYTTNRSGAAFFDADLNGQPGIEKLTVCDNKSDGRGIRAQVYGNNNGTSFWAIQSDPSNDGHCESIQGNFYIEETPVTVIVYEYWGDNTNDEGKGVGTAIA
ncbi:hypothetical protein [Streptomyces acidiscabies]|uniref:Secreted protein n=1 Tax=Streptomyces acidiscabies TaxID=42234 RepID=A0A0L0JZD0_9ACTN|nr:hypothetical protein [Streptomyces acidiscabies]KND30864.1 hypothetical protein IQ63_27555 [Streptomyces acidiscabies]